MVPYKVNQSWFKMSRKDDTIAEIEIFDDIDSAYGVGPQNFKAKFDKINDAKTIKLLVNSPGGSVFDGMAIYNILRASRAKLDVEVIGLAASVASIIALAGRSLTIADGAYFMIHNPFTITAGGAEDLRKTADLLDKMQGEFITIYRGKSGLSDKEIKALMEQETWMTAAEAIRYGFADKVEDYGQLAARTQFNLARFQHAPSALALNSSDDLVRIRGEIVDDRLAMMNH